MMIGILGASGLIGYNLYVFLRDKGIQTIGSYHSMKKDGLVYKGKKIINWCPQV